MSTPRIHQLQSHLVPSPAAAAQPPAVNPVMARIPSDMPGPWKSGHPLYGNSKEVAEAFFNGKLPSLFEKWRQTYGKNYVWMSYSLMTRRLEPQVVVTDFKEMNRLMKLNPPKPEEYEHLLLLGHGVLSQHDMTEWARQRELLKPVFSVGALKRIVPVMESGSRLLIDYIGKHADANQPFDFHDYISDLAFEMIGHSALGEETAFLRDKAGELRHAFDVVLNKGFLGEDPQKDPEYKAAEASLSAFAAEVFQRHHNQQKAAAKGHGQGGSAAQCPFASQHAPKEQTGNATETPAAIDIILGSYPDGTPFFNERQKKDQLSTFMFAGHETTANTLSWIMLELSRNQRCQDKLRQNINTQLANIRKEKGPDYSLTFTDLFKFDYLTLVINEALRLWPVVALGTTRILTEDVTIGGHLMPKGSLIRFPHYLVHRDPDIWERPDEFIPERNWVNDAFMPFARAPRDCLGRNLAMLEIRSFLVAIIPKFKFELDDPQTPIVGYEAGTMRPENGAWLKATRIQ